MTKDRNGSALSQLARSARGFFMSHWRSISVFLLATACLAFLIVYGTISPRDIAVALLLQPLNLACLFFLGWRFRVLSSGTVDIVSAIKANALSGCLFYVLPSRISELAKPVYLSLRCHIPLIRGTAILGIERFLDVVVVGLAVAVQLSFFVVPELNALLPVWWAAMAIGIAGLVLLYLKPNLIPRLVRLLPFAGLRAIANRFVEELQIAIAARGFGLAIIISAFVWFVSYVLIYAVLITAGSIPLTPEQVLVVFLAGTLGIAVAITPGGAGTFEAASVLALKSFGYTFPEALGLTVLMRLSAVGLTPLIVLWTLIHDGTVLSALVRKIRQIKPTV